ncbi:MAG TPA: murein biosynthesis integral membrane protein MurJ [Flexivirga sp.]|uniref:murein biosynthesis integral membrane protein MurJ n=1 Tax=Flexivirga sp. TaxID=1962927 RepID=UPI002BD53720|nr:murein biosynthesis integral membrane protein MurJ [Flexivirga sp.]HWC22692.1 murein biosynthesis integral membrane protein MurJ [Flexivirga sp.]
MTDESRPSLGQLYAESDLRSRAAAGAPEGQGSLGSMYAAWIGEDSGYLPLPDPDVIAARKDAIARGEDPDVAPPAAIPAEAPAAEGGIGRASAVMAAGTLVSRALGFVRTILMAALIIGVAGNVWETSNKIPNQIYLLLAGGVINAVLVPQITRALKDPDGGKAYTDRILTLAMSILLGATVIFMAAAPVVFKVGYVHATGDTWRLGILFTLLCMPQLFFYGLYTMLGEILNARSRFGALMWSPALANVFAIAGVVWLLVADHHRVGDPADWTTSMVVIFAGSATLGIIAQAVVLIIPLRRSGYTWSPNFSFRGVGLRSTSTIAGWAFGAVIVQQLGVFLVTGNLLNPIGSANQAQGYAFLFFMLPHSLVTLSLITALFTRMSRAAHEGRTRAVAHDTEFSLRLSSVATMPATFGALVAAGPLCAAFYPSLATAVERQTIALLIGLVPFTVCVVVQRALFAYQDAKTPFKMQVWCTIITSVLAVPCILLPDDWRGFGVCLAGSIAYFVEATLGYRWLRDQQLPGLRMVGVAQTWARLAVASVFAMAVAFAARYGTELLTGHDSRLANFVVFVVAVVVFLVLYVLFSRRLHVKEVEELVDAIQGKLGGVRRLLGR